MAAHGSIHASDVPLHIHFLPFWVLLLLWLEHAPPDLHLNIPEPFLCRVDHIGYLSVGPVAFVFLVEAGVGVVGGRGSCLSLGGGC